MSIPSFRFTLADPELGPDAARYLFECVEEGMISSQGRFVRRFEAEFAAACGVEHAVAVSNGTCALHLALVALGIGPGDEVLVPSLTFISTANAVIHAGAIPVFADVDPESLCVTPATLAPHLTPRTRAILPVHLLGQPCDMPALLDFARARDLRVIEDAAEAHGASISGRPVGSFGDIACFSFYANKIITTGEGGLCATHDASLAARMRLLRSHGMNPERRYWHDEIGFNYRMTNLQAAVGVAQMPHLAAWVERRRQISSRYRELLAAQAGELFFLDESSSTRSACWMSAFFLRDAAQRDPLLSVLSAAGVESRPLFAPIHLMPPYIQSPALHLPVTEAMSARGVLLPSHTKLTDADLGEIAAIVADAVEGTAAPHTRRAHS